MPLDAIDVDVKARDERHGAFARNVGQRLLLERDPLELSRGVAVPQDLGSDGLAVAGADDVSQEDGRGGVERRCDVGLERDDEVGERPRRPVRGLDRGGGLHDPKDSGPAGVGQDHRAADVDLSRMVTTPAVKAPCSMWRPTSTPAPTASCVRRPGR